MVIIVGHYKDPYETNSIMESKARFVSLLMLFFNNDPKSPYELFTLLLGSTVGGASSNKGHLAVDC